MALDDPELTQRFDHAFALAAELHRDQTRKGTEVPYLSHLMAVAGLVLETRAYRACDHLEDLAIAALLHDAVEDQGHRITLAQIRERFGDRVHDIVAACTDAVVTEEGQEKPPWRERKEAYLSSIPGKSGDALVVSCADKLHNARSILFDHDWIGDEIWDRFNPTGTRHSGTTRALPRRSRRPRRTIRCCRSSGRPFSACGRSCRADPPRVSLGAG